MKVPCVVVALAVLAAPCAVLAEDGLKDRVEQCVRDNERAKVHPDIMRRYCLCMSKKMGVAEGKTITQWEADHPKEREACDIESDWAPK